MQAQQNLEPLVTQLIAGNAQAANQLYGLYSKMVFNALLRLCNKREDAEDLLQETFIKAFKSINFLAEPKSFGSWVKRIAINEALQFIRKQKIEFFDIQNIEPIEEAVTDELAFSAVELSQAINQLPAGCKQIFTLFAIEDFSHRQIADELSITESTSKTQYMRAKQLLRNTLKSRNYER